MMGGILGKALAGAGKGLAIAGELGYRGKIQSDLEAMKAEITAKHDAFLNAGQDARLNKELAGREAINTADLASRASEGKLERQNRLDAVDRTLSAKDNKPITVPKGAVVIAQDGTELFNNTDGTEEKLLNVPEGTRVIDPVTRKEVFHNPKTPDAADAAKADEAVMKRLTMLKDLAKSRMGVDFFQKLNDDERKQFDAVFIDAAKNSRTMPNIEDAYESAIKKWNSVKSTKTVTGGAGGGLSDERKRQLDNLIGR